MHIYFERKKYLILPQDLVSDVNDHETILKKFLLIVPIPVAFQKFREQKKPKMNS
jgi:hypothetical protein